MRFDGVHVSVHDLFERAFHGGGLAWIAVDVALVLFDLLLEVAILLVAFVHLFVLFVRVLKRNVLEVVLDSKLRENCRANFAVAFNLRNSEHDLN